MDMQDLLVDIYDNKGGQYAIYDYVLATHPDWKWEQCRDCDDNTPTWDGVCAVCFSTR